MLGNSCNPVRPDLTGAGIGTGIDFFPVPVPVVPSYALDVALHRRLTTLMGLLDWEIDPDFPVGLERLELHDTPHTCCCSGVPGDSEASTKETQGQDEAQKVDALAVLWQVSLSMQLSPRRSQTERVVDLLASYRYMGSQLQAWKAFSTALSCSTCPL